MMKKTVILTVALSLSSMFAYAQQKPQAPTAPKQEAKPVAPSMVKTLIIASKKADCTGVAPMKCLQVKESKSQKNWGFFYDNIKGFNYKPGYEYVLQVKEEKVENPAADGSSLKYTLVKQISKTKK